MVSQDGVDPVAQQGPAESGAATAPGVGAASAARRAAGWPETITAWRAANHPPGGGATGGWRPIWGNTVSAGDTAGGDEW